MSVAFPLAVAREALVRTDVHDSRAKRRVRGGVEKALARASVGSGIDQWCTRSPPVGPAGIFGEDWLSRRDEAREPTPVAAGGKRINIIIV